MPLEFDLFVPKGPKRNQLLTKDRARLPSENDEFPEFDTPPLPQGKISNWTPDHLDQLAYWLSATMGNDDRESVEKMKASIAALGYTPAAPALAPFYGADVIQRTGEGDYPKAAWAGANALLNTSVAPVVAGAAVKAAPHVAKAARQLHADERGTIGGRFARNFPAHKVSKADELWDKGAMLESIADSTSLFPDSYTLSQIEKGVPRDHIRPEWKFFISDDKGSIDYSVLTNPDFLVDPSDPNSPLLPMKSSDWYKNPPLYENYPELADMPIQLIRGTDGGVYRGIRHWRQNQKPIELGVEGGEYTAVHELGEHAVANIEGGPHGADYKNLYGAGLAKYRKDIKDMKRHKTLKEFIAEYYPDEKIDPVDMPFVKAEWRQHQAQTQDYIDNGIPQTTLDQLKEDAAQWAYDNSAGEVSARLQEELLRRLRNKNLKKIQYPWKAVDTPYANQLFELQPALGRKPKNPYAVPGDEDYGVMLGDPEPDYVDHGAMIEEGYDWEEPNLGSASEDDVVLSSEFEDLGAIPELPEESQSSSKPGRGPGATSGDQPDPSLFNDFRQLGLDQRGTPEFAMLDVQNASGGGVLNPVVEHTGDLIHRMSHMADYSTFPDIITEKTSKVLRTLKSGYGFEKEMAENIRNNAKFRNVPPEQIQADIDKSLAKYADAHRALPAYNLPQRLAKEASIAVGEKRWKDAIKSLEELQALAAKPEAFEKLARGRSNALMEPEVDDGAARSKGPHFTKLYHGSPHDWDKPEVSARTLGTGEGAATYGVGLNTAQERKVAERYKDQLSDTVMTYTLPGNEPRTTDDAGTAFWDIIQANNLDKNTSGKVLDHMMYRLEQNFPVEDAIVETMHRFNGSILPEDITKGINAATSANLKWGSSGKLYEFGLKADPNTFLDWDRPLQDQAQMLPALHKAGLTEAASVGELDHLRKLQNELPLGSRDLRLEARINAILDEQLGPGSQFAPRHLDMTQHMAKAGIPGHKFLDQFSRGFARKHGAEAYAYQIYDRAGGNVDKAIEEFKLRLKGEKASNARGFAPKSKLTELEEAIHLLETRQPFDKRTRNFIIYNTDVLDLLSKNGLLGLVFIGGGAASNALMKEQPEDE